MDKGTESKEMQKYFGAIEAQLNAAYKTANEARKRGYDPEEKVDIPLAHDMAERVEGLISAVTPQLVGSGMIKRIRELEKEYGALAWEVALKIAEEVAQEKFCKFNDKRKAMEVGIRVGFAYHTLGIVSAPLEGFVELKIKKRRDGKDYLALSYAGPVRGAGGTGASFSIIIADYVRKKMGYDVYDPDEKEINRTITELYDYHEFVTNLQYRPSKEEIALIVKNLPVEVDGDPTEKIEVSNYKDLGRVSTNQIRSGVCLVISMLALKAPKLWKKLQKFQKEFGIDWSFLEKFLELQKKKKSGTEAKEEKKITPNYTYISDLVAGRPVLSHPSAAGGFRLRYGRSRTSGFSAAAIHPATMHILNRYVAVGTQLKVERPGKAAAITSCDTIDGPIIKLNNGNVVKISTEQEAKENLENIKEILFLGDILINYGDFSENGHLLVPAGYCEEWYVQELEKATVDLFGSLDVEKLSNLVEAPAATLAKLLKNPLEKISASDAINISKKLNIPLHPSFSYYWSTIPTDQFLLFLEWLKKANIVKEEKIIKIILPFKEDAKRILELVGAPHLAVNEEFVVIEKEEAESILASLNITSNEKIAELEEFTKKNKEKNPLEIINSISEIKLRDKAGTFIGARMGRPEKSKMRKLTGSPQVLFPVGEEGGRLRSFQSATEIGKVRADLPIYHCSHCKKETVLSVCETCDKKTKKKFFCRVCGTIDDPICKKHGEASTFKTQDININEIFDAILNNKLKTKNAPDLIKGVRGTSNKDHIPENIIKGIIRAKHAVYVNKDGTIRYDMTELPITHFKPKEIKTSVQKLKELGYERDIFGKELETGNQIVELKPQDIILPAGQEALDETADIALLKIANFVDELLVAMYGQQPFYNFKSKEDLIGCLVVGLAPHISAGMIGRVIGFSETQGCYAHPLWHAALRRDCLSHDCYVPICYNNQWRNIKIGEFVESLNPDKKADNFGTLVKEIKGYSTFSLNPLGKIEICKIKDITKHRPSALLRIEVEDGRSLELTEDHKVLVKSRTAEFFYKQARLLKKGDKVVQPFKLDVAEKDVTMLDLLKIFKNYKGLMIRRITKQIKKYYKKHGINEILKKCKIKKGDFYNYLARDSYPVDVVDKILEGKFNKLPASARVAFKNDKVELPIKIKLTNDALYLLGLYIAEGFSRKSENRKGFYQVYIAAQEKEQRKRIYEIMRRHFGLVPTEKKKDRMTYSSKLFYLLITNVLRLGSNAHEKRISDFLLKLPTKRLAHLIQGYFDGDGSVSSGELRVSCDTVSERLIEDLYFSLARFGIFFRKYSYEKKPGPKVREFYIRKNREIPTFKITKLVISSDHCLEYYKQIGFRLSRKKRILKSVTSSVKKTRPKIEHDKKFAYPEIISIKKLKPKETYCLNIEKNHNFIANNMMVHNCDGDECCIMLLMDALLNFSRQFLPDKRGGRTMDSPLVLTTKLIPSEVDDMVHGMDVVKKYPLELYDAALNYKYPSGAEIEKLGKRLGTEAQYEGLGFTHDVSSINSGVLCSAYKTIPSMEDKLKGQMELAERIRAVDAVDVARLVIEKHLLRDIRGNLRKFSTQQFRCVKCNEKFRRPPLIGKCTKCGGKIIFTVSEGSIVKYLEPTLSLAEKYNLPSYLRQTLELTKRMIEGVFGKQKEKQTGLGKWFG